LNRLLFATGAYTVALYTDIYRFVCLNINIKPYENN
jgi:hypothetical protein